MHLDVLDAPERKRFEADLGNGEYAFAAYNRLSTAIMFTHSEVPVSHEGQGIGSALIRASLDAARAEGLKVMPVCPFFASYMKRHPETHDLLESSYAKLLGVAGTPAGNAGSSNQEDRDER